MGSICQGSLRRLSRIVIAMDDQFLELLANPNDPERPKLIRSSDYLVCTKSGVGFPILYGIPQLLPECEISADKMKELLKNE